MKDLCGKEIKRGAVVDYLVDGMLAAFVVDVTDASEVADAQGRTKPGVIVLNLAITLKIGKDSPAPCYVIRDPVQKEESADAEAKDDADRVP